MHTKLGDGILKIGFGIGMIGLGISLGFLVSWTGLGLFGSAVLASMGALWCVNGGYEIHQAMKPEKPIDMDSPPSSPIVLNKKETEINSNNSAVNVVTFQAKGTHQPTLFDTAKKQSPSHPHLKRETSFHLKNSR